MSAPHTPAEAQNNLTPAAVPAVVPLLTLHAQVESRCSLARTPLGDRRIVDVRGGRFEGPQLRGRVLPSGGDWVLSTASVTQMDVRLVLQTDDGVNLLLRYVGRTTIVDGQPRIRVCGTFEAPEGRYGWLNGVVGFALGTPTADGVRYDFHQFA